MNSNWIFRSDLPERPKSASSIKLKVIRKRGLCCFGKFPFIRRVQSTVFEIISCQKSTIRNRSNFEKNVILTEIPPYQILNLSNRRQHQLWAAVDFVWHTVIILINATILMHNSNLSTNNFGNNHFGQSTKNKIFLKSLDYNGVCVKNFQRKEQNYKMRFWPKFPFFWEVRNFKKLLMKFYFTNRCLWCFCDSWYYLSA